MLDLTAEGAPTLAAVEAGADDAIENNPGGLGVVEAIGAVADGGALGAGAVLETTT